MTYLLSFLFCGFICLVGQIILDNSKLTPGHVTCLFVVIGAVLGFFGLYTPLREMVGAGASMPIVSFGDLLYQAAFAGLKSKGILGIFSQMYYLTGAGITAAVAFSFIFSLFSKVKD